MFIVDKEMTTKELNACKRDMINHGECLVWLTGSHKKIYRNIYEKDGKCYVTWFKSFIEVTLGKSGDYISVEKY